MDKKKVLFLTGPEDYENRISRLIEESSEFQVCKAFVAFSSQCSDLPTDFTLASFSEKPDIIIVSLPPDYIRAVLEWAVSHSVPVVVEANDLPKHLMVSIKNYYSTIIPIFMYDRLHLSINIRLLAIFFRLFGHSNDRSSENDNNVSEKRIFACLSFLLKKQNGFYSMDYLPD